MGDVIAIRRRPEKRRRREEDYVRGQQILANAIFHWKNDPSEDARAAVRFLLHHVATCFRADDEPLKPERAGSSTAPDHE